MEAAGPWVGLFPALSLLVPIFSRRCERGRGCREARLFCLAGEAVLDSLGYCGLKSSPVFPNATDNDTHVS